MNEHEFISECKKRKYVIIDIETNGLDPLVHDILILNLGWEDYVKTSIHPDWISFGSIAKILTDPEIKKVGHNVKFDAAFIKHQHDIEVAPLWDTMLVSRCIDNWRERRNFSLEFLVGKYLNEEMDKELRGEFIKYRPKDLIPLKLLEYSKDDVVKTDKLLKVVNKEMKKGGLEEIANLECQVIPSIVALELNGIYLDQDKWMELYRNNQKELEDARNKLDDLFRDKYQETMFGWLDINYNSPEQLKKALHTIGYEINDTRKDTISELPFYIKEPIEKFRNYLKATTTYGEKFLSHIHKKTGRVHPQYFQFGAASGRIIATDPNLQQMKHDADYRTCFTGQPDSFEDPYIIKADLKQIEIRLMAEESGEEGMIKTLQDGGDIHQWAADILHIDRKQAKNCMFALTYQAGVEKLALMVGVNIDTAQEYFDRIVSKFPTLMEYQKEQGQAAWQRGFSESKCGRRRYFDNTDYFQKAKIERQGANHMIQSLAASCLKQGLIRTYNRLNKDKSRIVTTIHDEIVVETSGDYKDEATDVIERSMVEGCEVYMQAVPAAVDLDVTRTWN